MYSQTLAHSRSNRISNDEFFGYLDLAEDRTEGRGYQLSSAQKEENIPPSSRNIPSQATSKMGTPFITFLGPSNLAAYDSSKRSSEQADTIPKTFLDAMEVREQVFVDEQKVPLQNEFDSDDHRSCHW
jgi:hypothetical protein